MDLSAALGHADPSITLRTYVHAMPDAEQRTRAHDERPLDRQARAQGRRLGSHAAATGTRTITQGQQPGTGGSKGTRTRTSRPGPPVPRPDGPGRKVPAAIPQSPRPPPPSRLRRDAPKSRRERRSSQAGIKALRAHCLSGGKPHSPFPPGTPLPALRSLRSPAIPTRKKKWRAAAHSPR
jgi:hypothetical protein